MGLGISGGEGSEGALDFLEWLLSEGDAHHHLEMPKRRQCTARDYSILSGRPFEECQDALEDMSSRMPIIRRHCLGQDCYEFMNAELSYWEWVIQN